MEPLFIKSIDLHPTPLLKKTQRLYHKYFQKFFRVAILWSICKRQVLKYLSGKVAYLQLSQKSTM